MEEKEKELKMNQKPTSWKKVACCLSAAFVAIIILFIATFPMIRGLFSASSDEAIDAKLKNALMSPSSKSFASAVPYESTDSTDYSTTQSCTPLELISAIPLDISPNRPGLRQDIDTHYYQVYGVTANEVRNQLNACGAKTANESYDAYTSYYINWIYNQKPVSGGCNVKDVAVGAKIDYFYPKWDDPGNTQGDVVSRWQNYMANLIVHEELHKDIAVSGAQAILDTLSTLPDSATCDEATTLAGETASALFTEYDNKNKAYDDETQHGLTQGAVFP